MAVCKTVAINLCGGRQKVQLLQNPLMPYKNKNKQRACQRKWQAKKRQTRSPERIMADKAGNLRRRKERIEWLNKLRNQMECKECGFSHPAVLDFHHRNKEEKEFDISAAVGSQYSKKRILVEISKCDVLCSNCHRILHWDERQIAGMG